MPAGGSDSPAKRPKDRASHIVTAAAQLFREQGYHTVGIDDIGEAVGISGPAVYRHFPSKSAVLVATAQRSLERFDAAYRDGLAAAATPEARVEALVRANLAGTIDDLDLAAVMLREQRHLPAELQRDIRQQLQFGADLWVSNVRSVRPELSEREVAFLCNAALGVGWSLIHYEAALPRRRVEDLLTRVTLAALLTPPTTATAERASELTETLLSRPTPITIAGTNGDDGASAPYRGSRREVILAVATRLFRQHGYGGVGIDEIGEAAGISGPAVYRHFDNKEDLLGSALNRLSEQLAASAGRVLSSAPTPRDALDGLIESFLTLEVENADLVFVYLTESHALSTDRQRAVRRAQRAYVDEWVATVRQLRPELAETEVRVMVHAVIGIINTYSQIEAPQLPLAHVVATLTTMALAGLLQS